MRLYPLIVELYPFETDSVTGRVTTVDSDLPPRCRLEFYPSDYKRTRRRRQLARLEKVGAVLRQFSVPLLVIPTRGKAILDVAELVNDAAWKGFDWTYARLTSKEKKK